MTLTINLPPATVERLQAQAAASGKDVDTFVREAVEAKLAIPGSPLRETLAPIHEDFRKSGMSEQQLDDLIDEAVSEARAARKSKRTA
jgi:hypothetical protein